MKQIYKAGGIRKTESGAEYTIRAVSDADRVILLGKGWVSTIEEVEPKAEEDKSPFDLEAKEAAEAEEAEKLEAEKKAAPEDKKKTKAK